MSIELIRIYEDKIPEKIASFLVYFAGLCCGNSGHGAYGIEGYKYFYIVSFVYVVPVYICLDTNEG